MIRKEKTPSRNAPCPCGSGKKAKKCCLNQIKDLAQVAPEYRRAYVAEQLIRKAEADRAKQEAEAVKVMEKVKEPVLPQRYDDNGNLISLNDSNTANA
jgi:hypothetical protein